MAYRPGDKLNEDFVVERLDSGNLTNADELPGAILVCNGLDDPSVTLTVTCKSTGRYLVRGTIPATYDPGDRIDVYVQWQVNSIWRGKILHSSVLERTVTIALMDAREAEQRELARKVELSRMETAREDERMFMELAIEEARRSVIEDGRIHPKVGAVVVKDGKVLASAHRGELGKGDHAEYTALEKKLADKTAVGATVYTTLEPCTTRNHPKVPCAKRLVERKVKRVVIGTVDPNPDISGKGILLLRNHNIQVSLFPDDLMSAIEELNRDFNRAQEQAGSTNT
jgi:pyrimidine deaminase RibD-like protein